MVYFIYNSKVNGCLGDFNAQDAMLLEPHELEIKMSPTNGY